MIHPSDRGFHPKVRMIGHFRTRYFFSGAICFDFHPTDHPMDHPRIILPISEPDPEERGGRRPASSIKLHQTLVGQPCLSKRDSIFCSTSKHLYENIFSIYLVASPCRRPLPFDCLVSSDMWELAWMLSRHVVR